MEVKDSLSGLGKTALYYIVSPLSLSLTREDVLIVVEGAEEGGWNESKLYRMRYGNQEMLRMWK